MGSVFLSWLGTRGSSHEWVCCLPLSGDPLSSHMEPPSKGGFPYPSGRWLS